MSRWPAAGVGVALGYNGVIAVDFDTDDPVIIEAIEAALPPSPVRKRGAKVTAETTGQAQRSRPPGAGKTALACSNGSVMATVARHGLPGKMADDDLVSPPPVSPAIIRDAVWLYVRFTLSYRDVEDLLAERGLEVSYETVRRWVLKFGPLFARELRRRRPRPTSQWHLDEMAVIIQPAVLAVARG